MLKCAFTSIRQGEDIGTLYILVGFLALITVAVLLVGRYRLIKRLGNAQAELETLRHEVQKTKMSLDELQTLSKIGFWEWDVNEDIVMWSDETYRIYGYDVTPEPIHAEHFFNRIHPEDRGRVRDIIETSMKNRQMYEMDFRIVLPEGTIKHIIGKGFIKEDVSGNIERIYGTGQDVTHYILVQEQLQESRQRYQSLVENIHDWVWEVDGRGLYTYVSPNVEDVLGYKPHEILGKSPFELMPPEEARRIEDRFIACVAEKSPIIRMENINIHKDGRLVVLETSGKPILDDSGELLGYRGMDRDVTERKAFETQLRQKEQMMLAQSRMAAMGEMLAMIAHQWRQPLSSISAIAGTLTLDAAMDAYDKAFFQQRLNDIGELSQHLSSTIDDFRNFFKEDKEKHTVTLEEMVGKSLLIIEPVLVTNGIMLHRAYENSDRIETFSNELMQVILNLLKNAQEALKELSVEQPQIWIRSYSRDGYACLSIEDNAGGIPGDVIERIFEPYFSTKTKKDGTGLGLYMSKVIIEQHCSGMLQVSNSEQGALFEICLPR